MASDVVAPTAHRDEQLMGAGELDGRDDVGHPGTADNERRVPVDHAIPDFADRVVAGVSGTQQLTTYAAPEGLDGAVLKHGVGALHGGDAQLCHGVPPFHWPMPPSGLVIKSTLPLIFRSPAYRIGTPGGKSLTKT